MVTDSTKSSVDLDNKEHEESSDAKRVIAVDTAGDIIDDSNPLPVIISDGIETADVIPTNGLNGVVAIAPGHISTDNSTSTPLDGDATFTGEWEDITNFGVIVVTINTSHVSATDGLTLEFSSNGADVDSTDVFTIPASTGKTFSFQAANQFFRVRYTNGNTLQTHIRLQTVLKPYYVKPSSHRIQDDISTEDDAELIKSVITGQKPNGDFTNFQGTTAGNFKVSIEEYDDVANPVRKDLEGGGKISVGTTAVEVTFTGSTQSIIITSDDENTGKLFIGKSDVVNDGSNSITFLQPGESLTIDYDDVDNAIYVISDTVSQNFYSGATL